MGLHKAKGAAYENCQGWLACNHTFSRTGRHENSRTLEITLKAMFHF